jgi:hypothetical protein
MPDQGTNHETSIHICREAKHSLRFRVGRLIRYSVSPSISGSPAGWFRSVPHRVVAQGGRSPSGATTLCGGEIHAATDSGGWLK